MTRSRMNVFGCCVLFFLLMSIGPSTRAAQFVNILTGGTSGIYYVLGVTLSRIYGEALADTKVSVQATKASVENLNLLQAGRGEIAFAVSDTVLDAWKGNKEAGFKEPLAKLRGIAGLYPNYVQIVASAESGIKSLDDLRGKRVSVGAPRSGTELNQRAVIKAAGMSYEDFGKVEYLPHGEAVELMKNRQLDVSMQSSGLGVASIRDLASSMKVVIVPVTPEVVKNIGNPVYLSAKIPAGTYDGQDADVWTAATNNLLVTHSGVPEDVVYEMTKGLYENLGELVASHAAASAINISHALDGMPVPLHPGAERYYREKGLIK